jgi:proteasome lid subunit RPN8/RPN11
VKVEIAKRLVRRIKLEAKAHYPKEFLCYLLGYNGINGFTVKEIYTPPDVAEYSDKYSVGCPYHWWEDATDIADDLGMDIVGDCHSHTNGSDASLSERDCDSIPHEDWVSGVCSIIRTKRGLRVYSLQFWPYTKPLFIKVTK